MASPVTSISTLPTSPAETKGPRVLSGKEGFAAVFEDAQLSTAAGKLEPADTEVQTSEQNPVAAGCETPTLPNPALGVIARFVLTTPLGKPMEVAAEPVRDVEFVVEPAPIVPNTVTPLAASQMTAAQPAEGDAREETAHTGAEVLLILANTEQAKALRLVPSAPPPAPVSEPCKVSLPLIAGAQTEAIHSLNDKPPQQSLAEMVFQLAFDAPPAASAPGTDPSADLDGEEATLSDPASPKPVLIEPLVLREKGDRKEAAVPSAPLPSQGSPSASPEGVVEAVPFTHAATASHSTAPTTSPDQTQPTRPGSMHFMDKVATEHPKLAPSSLLQRIGIVVREQAQSVRLDIQQSRGDVKVAVHSDDAALAAQLRESLPELLHRLDDSGVQARVTSLGRSVVPEAARTTSAGDSGQTRDHDQRSQDMNHDQPRRERNPRRAWETTTWKLEED